jgi:DNA-binding transcriptional regulator YdaS (Cro superfamily)
MGQVRMKWERGHKSALAKAVGLSPQYLCDIMANRKRCNADRAIELERICRHLGYRISRFEWAFPSLRYKNHLFPRQE